MKCTVKLITRKKLYLTDIITPYKWMEQKILRKLFVPTAPISTELISYIVKFDPPQLKNIVSKFPKFFY